MTRSLIASLAVLILVGPALAATLVFDEPDAFWSEELGIGWTAELAVVLPDSVGTVTAVRGSITAQQQAGWYACCIEQNDCTALTCYAKVAAYFLGHVTMRANKLLTLNDGPTWGFEFLEYPESWDPSLTSWPPSVGEASWDFLTPGEHTLVVKHPLRSCDAFRSNVCTATLGATSLHLEIDFEVAVPNEAAAWGRIKVLYR